jgi:hypothetical protein
MRVLNERIGATDLASQASAYPMKSRRQYRERRGWALNATPRDLNIRETPAPPA